MQVPDELAMLEAVHPQGGGVDAPLLDKGSHLGYHLDETKSTRPSHHM